MENSTQPDLFDYVPPIHKRKQVVHKRWHPIYPYTVCGNLNPQYSTLAWNITTCRECLKWRSI